MQNLNKPAGFQTVIPYLIIPQPETLIEFAAEVFGAEEVIRHTDDESRIRHAELRIDDTILMMGGSTKEWSAQPAGLFIYVTNADATYQKALAAGATSVMPPADQDYGRACGVKDTNGNTWWITTSK